jgi:diguanylate cyclase (GGDEF)-like protein/PAS domain S-box-containing protein
MHRVLRRQLRRFGGSLTLVPADWAGFLTAVDRSYREADEARRAGAAWRESEVRSRMLFASNPQPCWVYDRETLAFLEVNDATVQHYGWSRDEFLRMAITDIRPAEEVPRLLDHLARTAPSFHHAETWRHRTKDGRSIEVDLSSHPLMFDGRPAVLVAARDVTERRRAERALRVSEERYALAAAGANDGLWDWCLDTGDVYYSPRWKTMLGYAEEDIGAAVEEWLGRVHPEDRSALEAQIAAHLSGSTQHLEIEYRIRHRDGGYRWVLTRGLASRREDGRAHRIAGSQTDVTQRKVAEERLMRAALYDPLTALPNRAVFIDRLDRRLQRSRRRPERRFAVLFLDLDRFKRVNDSLGHVAGDELLVTLAARLTASLRPEDTVARLGGDEFAILLDEIGDLGDATRVAERVHQELRAPFEVGGQEIVATVSIGIAIDAQHYKHPEDMLRDADTAMYRAKSAGRARHEVFDDAMHAHAVALLRLESELRHALERREFRVAYQPIVSFGGGLIGFEALLRWLHPERGLIGPQEFIPLAEDTGLIAPIGEWVLREACCQLRRWHNRHGADRPGYVSVNLSAKQFALTDLGAQIATAVAEFGADPRHLSVEITETVLMDHAEATRRALDALRALGVAIQIDDFGTGYSALSYLQRFDIDALKLDRSFIRALVPDGDSVELVRAIVTLAKSLRIRVIAEGVETGTQWALLEGMGCDYAQGNLIAPALDPLAAGRLLDDGSTEAAPEWRRPEALTPPAAFATPCLVESDP